MNGSDPGPLREGETPAAQVHGSAQSEQSRLAHRSVLGPRKGGRAVEMPVPEREAMAGGEFGHLEDQGVVRVRWKDERRH